MSPDPLVTVVITTYNHSKYILDAIKSVRRQTYSNIELVIVDDGSTDGTKELVSALPECKYIYQHNQGLSAARNTGLANSNGAFILFLDADDWLLDDAVSVNMKIMLAKPGIAFVSGSYRVVNEQGEILYSHELSYADAHYLHLLEGNFIGMHAAVLYSTYILQKFKYDVSLSACEDYDMYLQITRDLPIESHPYKIAMYRRHDDNMSSNSPLMLKNILRVLDKQKPLLRNDAEKNAWQQGRNGYISLYLEELIEGKLKAKRKNPNLNELLMMVRYPRETARIMLKKNNP